MSSQKKGNTKEPETESSSEEPKEEKLKEIESVELEERFGVTYKKELKFKL